MLKLQQGNACHTLIENNSISQHLLNFLIINGVQLIVFNRAMRVLNSTENMETAC